MVQNKRCGLSLIEVLVVIAIVGILMALIVPAVQATRQSARLVECKDHIRQVGLAMASYESAKGHWPTSLLGVLPFCDHEITYGVIRDWETDSIKNGFTSNEPMAANVPIFECPADSHMPRQHRGRVSYRMNDGTSVRRVIDSDRLGNGVLYRYQKSKFSYVRPSMVTDGLSATAMLSERLFLRDLSQRPSLPQRTAWAVSGPIANAQQMLTGVQSTTSWDWTDDTFRFHTLVNDRCYDPARYEHVLPPNSRAVWASDSGGLHLSTRPATSEHAGGVNVAFCDGSVRFISDEIDPKIWMALGTRAGQEVTGDEFQN